MDKMIKWETVLRHCEGDSPKQSRNTAEILDCFATLAMTYSSKTPLPKREVVWRLNSGLLRYARNDVLPKIIQHHINHINQSSDKGKKSNKQQITKSTN